MPVTRYLEEVGERVTNNEVKVVDDVGDDDIRRKNEGANEAETSKLFFI